MGNQIIVVGAGASGLVAAIAAAQKGALVTILEHNDKAGRKLLVTGNGRCNLLNMKYGSEYYMGEHREIIEAVCLKYSVEDALEFYHSIGLGTMDRDGYVYPSSNQAVSVLDALLAECQRLKVKIKYNNHVSDIYKDDEGFGVVTDTYTYRCDKIILATGSKTAAHTGSDGSGYKMAARVGHHIVKPLPALTSFICNDKCCNRLAGVRAKGEVSLEFEGRKISSGYGEVQFTANGISGIPVFQISRYASIMLDLGRKVDVTADLYPAMDKKEITDHISRLKEKYPDRTIVSVLCGMLNNKLAEVIINECGIKTGEKMSVITGTDIEKLVDKIKTFILVLKSVNDFDNAQVCRGGVDTSEIAADTMESAVVKDMYITGELLDVDGLCGGYNLFWAWATGFAAGNAAAEEA